MQRKTANGSSARREELLAIAAEMFAAQGFLATTVREIADTAGILSGSLYHHFDSKESMVDEILRDFLDSQQRAYNEVLREHTDAREVIIELVRVSFRSIGSYQQAIAIFQNESKYLSQFERFSYLKQISQSFERTWLQVLQQGLKAGVFRADLNPKLVYRFIRDTVWTTVHWYNPRGRLSTDTIADQYITILCDGIIAR
ncbi:TetR/AcrR family transcriptional regulator [Solihabitans fulvus]|uniref:TetR/AcrR family transcriptional regulator n=1 Tax=Solihabitans fulvus TaxID=1892852 RepID=UPI001CB764F0|nr:TetR/AcrR family transcriptional regulator [Solihabitans fulvus]